MHRAAVMSAFDAAVAATGPEQAVRNVLATVNGGLAVGEAFVPGVTADRLRILALGKAAPGMARGVFEATGCATGLAVSDHEEPCPIPLMVGDHPVPGDSSLEAGEALVREASTAGRDDVIVACISGGGSALAEVPQAGISRADLRRTNEILIRSGLPIEEMNEVRAAISAIKAGGLASMMDVRSIVTLVMSDVVGGGPEFVASGPTIPSSLGGRAPEVVARGDLSSVLPASVVRVARSHTAAQSQSAATVMVVASPRHAGLAAQAELRGLGIDASLADAELRGPVDGEVAAIIDGTGPGEARIAVGETTLEVTGSGLGGRNQHAALLAAMLIEGTDRVFGAFGTDGRDGPTEVAGAIVDGASAERMRAAGVDPLAAAEDFDAYTALTASGDAVVTGRTGTNVADVWISGSRQPIEPRNSVMASA